MAAAAAAAATGGLRWVLAALCLGCAAGGEASGPRVLGFCLEEDGDGAEGPVWARGRVVRAAPGAAFRLRLFGSGFANRSWPWVAFAPAGEGCPEGGGEPEQGGAHGGAGAPLSVNPEAVRPHSALLAVRVEPGGPAGGARYRLCSRGGPQGSWTPAAEGDSLAVEEEPLLPWALGLLAAALLGLAALARGLQLSALALEPAEVQVLRESGSEAERAAARRLEPLRRWGSFALCALLLLASLAQAALAVLLYRAVGQRAVPAVLGSAGLVYLVGEVAPAAVSGRWGLSLAPRALGLTRLAVLLTFPVALPVGKLLELALRPEGGRLRERVVDLARGTDPYNEFVREEFSKGALRCKTVEDVLTPLKDCFMLDSSAVLDFGVMSTIMQSGYTRIPVYEEERSNIVDMLYLKDLAFVDPEDCTPLSTIIRFYNHPLHFVFNDTKLDAVLEEFKRGENKVKKKPTSLSTPIERKKEEFSLFKGSDNEYKVKISPQLLLATQRFLSREVDLFSPLRISEKVLLHLLKHPSVNQEVKFDECNRLAADHYLYQRNQPVNYFILILQGRVEVEIGKEGLKFENGAFTYYGVSALSVPSSVHQSPASSVRPSRRELQSEPAESTHYSSTYCPDYTVRALSDLQFIKVTRLQYLNALMASRAQNSPQSPENLDLRIVPNSQTKLLNDKIAAAAGTANSRPNSPTEENLGRNTRV
ncbi:metal transporter CNNM3 isoform X2 [Notamacropus eugenii]|uniref:metal transporter CNNM3 isoform X2 n=1 Tax=Notamacropus eugenii TaxID=9315 RepID=UPI003B66EC73